MSSPSCSIFFHNYYGRHEDWVRLLSQKMEVPFTLYYNVVGDSLYNLEDGSGLISRLEQAISGPQLKKIILRRSSNQGKDIGGKLVLLDACLHEGENYDYSIFLHDKKSPYKIQNEQWREKLFRIVEPSFATAALHTFAQHKEVGIIAGSDSIYNEYDSSTQSFTSHNGPQLTSLRSELAVDNTDYRYVAGTMFWVRYQPLCTFFMEHPPLEIRKTLEKGNVLDETGGTITHAWERMLSWLIFAQGYTIKGL